MSGSDSVGSLLADIAQLTTEGLRILSLADKRHWGQDEYEQQQALEALLDEAKKDFQELPSWLNGQTQYQYDRKFQSLDELRSLIQKFQQHVRLLKDWSRSGGPINPIWIRDTQRLQTDLHRAQYRAARRIFTSGQEHTSRCLGAFLVHRKQRVWSNTEVGAFEGEYQRRYLDELVACKAVGVFERFGEQDVAFVCDFCDGHMIWEDLESVPTVRSAQDTVTSPISPVSPTSNNPYWQATGKSKSGREEKQTVFAPIVIANHIAPSPGEWQSRLICPFCEDSGEPPRDEDDEEEAGRPDTEFEDVAALQEHLEWQHTSSATNSSMPLQLSSSDSGCVAM